MSDTLNIALVGATGAVGREILELLAERDFPVGQLRLSASPESLGEALDFQGESILVEEVSDAFFEDADLTFFCGAQDVSARYGAVAVARGGVCVDVTGAWQSEIEVPLVVPEINADVLQDLPSRGIVACPAGLATQAAMVLKPLMDSSVIERAVITAFISASSGGLKGIEELRVQSGELLNGRPVEPKVFSRQIAFDCVAETGTIDEEGRSSDETALIHDTRRLLGASALDLSATVVRVPVFYGQAATIDVETREKISISQLQKVFSAHPELELVAASASDSSPTLLDAVGQDAVLIGRLRENPSTSNALQFWITSDNLRFGAAGNAVKVAEILVRHPAFISARQ